MSSIPTSIKSNLSLLASQLDEQGIRSQFEENPERFKRFTYQMEGFQVDHSKTIINEDVIEQYRLFAEQTKLPQKVKDMFAGRKINETEKRSVLHTLLRKSDDLDIDLVDETLSLQASDSVSRLAEKYSDIQRTIESSPDPIKNIIHIGIGGSSLGTQLVVESLACLKSNLKVHFLANIDAHQLVDILNQCDVSNTLVIGVSKTFTTSETLQNLNSIGGWFKQNGEENFLSKVYAVTASEDKALEYGIEKDNIIIFPEWVGGRYSVWSAVSLSAVLVLGIEKFDKFIEGAKRMDEYFYKTELHDNACFIGAAMDHFYSNFLGVSSRAVFPYDFRLRSLVSYLQQLETESNGKDRQVGGAEVDQKTSMVVWGGVGTDVQHSVFQLLHQGTAKILSEFLLVKNADHDYGEHHKQLLANGLAQPAALLAGQDLEQVIDNLGGENYSKELAFSKIFSGDRPSNTLVIDRLDALTLGALLAYYEHRTFCAGLLMNINSFDQMGVELGKQLAKQVKPHIDRDGEVNESDFDTSTKNLISYMHKE